ncbi:hypothetical protein A3K29_01230 [Candidatus Collierbacteria bacterium RIFOXYB2_FULL_46_14]|uniref:DUF1648 domain-containing protein n=1 Tax=Candidatus Collierbacteria bacterium GW2011_GWA2_46_26 TaxID=1618381 RepID=A0A0G1PIZ2_9BACT|nr:MAG: hypothetical protein UW29_C0009G0015 [Candidatus Collierbacteria bacterium GW2011_GWC2_44_13]KKU32774.1 MAG: hypothetical protein UX47_C0007G0018 [Candidatus Collierbacteria bacterium GW2011_GWA2_46_26]OGD72753.1 MAG: hypothetical protein A3K29_01230 [Candidatus Collierbacteria bacterium RIFOXYB2_FULL_46_14]OGD75795.1 MAG: hypothetical protein A3K43_01230 [Candidatus Collierbacteria bacterium RIFOXYA2_FULL_46_20]OGD77131.1 MAG: hypothetical protein A3K39_01230 [Candidatus Collierbacteri
MTTNKAAQQILIVSWGTVLVMGAVFALFWKILPPHLPWFYSLPGGEHQLISKFVLAGILLGLGAVVGITRVFASWASKGDVPVETTLMAGSLLAVGLLAASFFRVIQIFAL